MAEIIKPLHIKLSNDPIDDIAMTQDISSLVNGPLGSGVSDEANFGRNCTGHPRHKPFASITRLAVNKIEIINKHRNERKKLA